MGEVWVGVVSKITKDAQYMIDSVNDVGIQAQGRNEFISHLEGKTLTMKDRMKAKCYTCNGFYSDGKADCRDPLCPLYPIMPYNPNKGGFRNLSGESLEKLRERSLARGGSPSTATKKESLKVDSTVTPHPPVEKKKETLEEFVARMSKEKSERGRKV